MHDFLGEFEHMVLLTILALDNDVYGVPIREHLEERVGRNVARGALYTTLQRMERKGYIESRMGAPSPQRGGRPKRFWSVSAAGIRAIQASREAMKRRWEDVDHSLGTASRQSDDGEDHAASEVGRGRDFSRLDTYESDLVVIVNQLFADEYFPGEDPLGRRIRLGGVDSEGGYRTIIGIAPNLRMEGFGPSQGTGRGFYSSFTQLNGGFMNLIVRSARNDVTGMTQEVRDIVRGIDPDLPIFDAGSLRARIDQENWFYMVFGAVFMIFGAAALFMASVGLYGVLSFSVSRRIQEMGIRMALGAASGDVLKITLNQGMKQVVLGLGIGLVMAFGLTGIVGFIMFDVNPRDPTVFGGISMLILLVGIVASVVPAVKATRVDPVVALRAR